MRRISSGMVAEKSAICRSALAVPVSSFQYPSGAKIVAVAGSRKARATRAYAEEAVAQCRDLDVRSIVGRAGTPGREIGR